MRILYVEHNPVDVDLARSLLARRMPEIEMDAAPSVGAARECLSDPPVYPTVIANLRLPDGSGLEVLNHVRERHLPIAVVILIGPGDEESAAMAIQSGADDYLIKHAGYLIELPAVLEKCQHRAELARDREALRHREEDYRRLIEGLRQDYFFYRCDQDDHFTYVSPSVLPVLGYTPEEFAASFVRSLIESPINEKARWHRRQGKGGRAQPVYDIELRGKNGAIYTLELLETPIPGPAGTVLGVEGIAHDITSRKRAEEKLHQAAAVFYSTQEGMTFTDSDCRIIAVNPAFTVITGYTEEEVLGKNPRLLQSGRHDRRFYQEMWHAIHSVGYWQGEIWNRRKNGEIYPEWLTISAVRDERKQIVNYVGVSNDITKIKDAEAQLEHLAHHDPLTHLPNRLLVHSRLGHVLDQGGRQGHGVAVLFVDLDHFKAVNDSLGHLVGDEVLVAVGQRMQNRLRKEDTLARLGGDEFLVVLESLQRPEHAANVARDLLCLFEQAFVLSDGREVYLGASIGISIYPDDGATPLELIRNADAALYQAKEQGRNTYRFYTEALTRKASERLDLEFGFRRALEREELVLHYQPLLAVDSNRLTGAEALVRWQRPGGTVVPPANLIPMAEETGLIVHLDKWVLRTACSQAKAWMDQGMAPTTVSVNVASRQFQRHDLVAHVRTALETSGLPAQCLELEITESALMDLGDRNETVLKELKSLGVRLAIDDFGTGHSSLASLKRFPIDRLKIDRGFVREIPRDKDDMAIAATIIAMGRHLELEVLAEGVETEAQLDFLREQGCGSYQGYLCSPPLPVADFERWFLKPKEALAQHR